MCVYLKLRVPHEKGASHAKTLADWFNGERKDAGHAALPGGKSDTLSETPLETARREAHEEIGLPPPAPGTVYPSIASTPPASLVAETKYTPETPSLPYPFRLEHLCQLPTNLAKTELGVRPCVAFIHATSPVDRESRPVGVETTLIPRLDASEVAAVFSAPFRGFLRKEDEVGEKVEGSWYRGSWIDWHEERWRMHNFFVPVVGQTVTRPRRRDGKKESATSRVSQPSQSTQTPPPPPPSPPESTTPSSSQSTDDPLATLSRFRVFGMTARILVDCAQVAYGEAPEFEHNGHFGDERIIRMLIEMGKMKAERRSGEEFVGDDMKRALGRGSGGGL